MFAAAMMFVRLASVLCERFDRSVDMRDGLDSCRVCVVVLLRL